MTIEIIGWQPLTMQRFLVQLGSSRRRPTVFLIRPQSGARMDRQPPLALSHHFRDLPDPRRGPLCEHDLLDIIASPSAPPSAANTLGPTSSCTARHTATGSRPSCACPTASPPTTPFGTCSGGSTPRREG